MKSSTETKHCVPDLESTKMWAQELGIKLNTVTEILLNIQKGAMS